MIKVDYIGGAGLKKTKIDYVILDEQPLMHAQNLVTSKHTSLHTVEGNHTNVSTVLTPAQHLVTSKYTCKSTLEKNLTNASSELTPAQHLVT